MHQMVVLPGLGSITGSIVLAGGPDLTHGPHTINPCHIALNAILWFVSCFGFRSESNMGYKMSKSKVVKIREQKRIYQCLIESKPLNLGCHVSWKTRMVLVLGACVHILASLTGGSCLGFVEKNFGNAILNAVGLA